MSEYAANGVSDDGGDSLLIDLHSHSRYSDGTATLEHIERACLERRIGISLTDHNEIRGAIKLWERDRIPTIPGIEVGTIEGLEFLVYFRDPQALEDYYLASVERFLLSRFMVRSKLRSLAAIEDAQGAGGYVSLAHPFAPGRKSIEFHRNKGPQHAAFVDRVIKSVDAIELFNGGILRTSNRKADDFSTDCDKPVTAGSDSHHISTLGSCGIRYRHLHETRGPELFDAVAGDRGRKS
ncbi:MAG: PHP domain-containing protein [Planctomycetaceae bacterium]